jgi:type IV pilus assembly protein PilW
MKRPNKLQQGLTMIELAVTLAISAVILAGVVNIYGNSMMQSKLTSNLAAMQESGRFALELMARDVRMAGFTGCIAYDEQNPQADDAIYMLYKRGIDNNALYGLAGQEWNGSSYASTSLSPMVTTTTTRIGTNGGSWITSDNANLASTYADAIANSDVLQVWTSGEVGIDVSSYTADAAQIQLTVETGHAIKEGDVLMFSDCGKSFIAQVCAVTATQLTLTPGGSATCNNDFSGKDIAGLSAADVGTYGETLETYTFRDAAYFVGKRDNGTSTPPSLFRGVNGTAREMVEGVENMQVLYGVDLAHEAGDLRTPDKYVTADQVGTRWSDVVAVRITVLMRSFENVVGTATSNNYTFNFNGRTYTSTDGYLRQAYSTTIALRNRNIGEVPGLYGP